VHWITFPIAEIFCLWDRKLRMLALSNLQRMLLTSSHFASYFVWQIGFKSFDMLRQVCHVSCVHFGMTGMWPGSPGVFWIPKEAMPGQKNIVLKCVSQHFPLVLCLFLSNCPLFLPHQPCVFAKWKCSEF